MDLADFHLAAWDALRLGASPTRSPFTIWQFATLGLDGAPQLRSIVLRGADEAARTLSFHTDRRSPKVAEIAADARVSLLGVDLDSHRQIRVAGTAHVVEDAAQVRQMWSAARPHTLILYQAPLPPGTSIDAPEQGHVATQAQVEGDGFAQFALIAIRLQWLELLDLTPHQHRRARFHYDDHDANTRWRGQWIAP